MKYDVILAGVGGQGVLSIAAIIGMAAVDAGLHIKQAEVHGMSQRGGAVQSHLRIADHPIYSDLIPQGQTDMLLSMEPMETLRYVPFLSSEGVIVADDEPVINIPNYPQLDAWHEHQIWCCLEPHRCFCRLKRAILSKLLGSSSCVRAKKSFRAILRHFVRAVV